MKRIYLDLDGVMADFDGTFPALFGQDHRAMADDEMWELVNGHQTFFRDLPPMEGAVEFFRSIEHLHPIILTACPKSNYAHAAVQKVEWVRKHLSPHVTVLPVLGGYNKPLFMHAKGDILIDDFRRNTEAWTAAGGNAILHRSFEATSAALAEHIPIAHRIEERPAVDVEAQSRAMSYDDARRILQVAYMEGERRKGYNLAAEQLRDAFMAYQAALASATPSSGFVDAAMKSGLEVGVADYNATLTITEHVQKDGSVYRTATPSGPKCSTCNDHGMIGGPSYYNPGEGGDPCPDCASPSAAVGEVVPVAWMEPYEGGLCSALAKSEPWAKDVYTIPLYTTPTKPGHMMVTIEMESLPPGYRLGSHKDGSYWPLLGKGYISNDCYESKMAAKLAAWKHSHAKLSRTVGSISNILANAINATKADHSGDATDMVTKGGKGEG